MFSKIKEKFINFENKKDKVLMILLIINVIWVFFGIFSYNYFKFTYRSLSMSYILLFLVNLFVSVYFLIRKKFKSNYKDIFIILLVLFGIIATIFSKNISVSLYGYWQRNEGFLQLLYYYSLLYLGSHIDDSKYKLRIIYFIISFGIFNSIITILQVYNLFSFIPINYRGVMLGQGLMTNSNFLGSYMVLCLGLSIGLFLYEKNKKHNILNFIFMTVLYIGLLLSNALSGVVGFIFSLLFILIIFIYSLIKKNIKKYNLIKYLSLVFGLVFVNIALNNIKVNGKSKVLINKDLTNFVSETSEMSKGNVKDSYGSSRIFIWRNTLEVLPKHLLHGVGVDCFAFAFPNDSVLYRVNPDKSITYYDKVHNEYLQKFICEGLLSIVAYLSLLFFVFVEAIKDIFKKFDFIKICLFLSFVGYCIQAFFNISVIEVAPLFYIVCGLLFERKGLKTL